MDNQIKDQKLTKQPIPINPNPAAPEPELSLPQPEKPIAVVKNPIIPETPVSEPIVSEPKLSLPQPEKPITIAETPIVPETELPPSPPKIEEITPPSEYQNEYQGVLDQYAATQETTTPPVPENEPQPQPEPAITLDDLGITEKPPENNIFKIIFISSLTIFVLVAVILAFVFFKNQKSSPTVNDQSSTIDDLTPTISSGTCFLNDKTYQVGESFTATDGCNTCTCVSQDSINCSDNKCLSSKTSTDSALQNGSATPTSTSSAKKTTLTPSATTK